MRDVVLGLIAGIILGWVVHGIFNDRKLSALETSVATQNAADLKAALKSATDLQADKEKMQQQLAQQDKTYTDNLGKLQDENTKLHDCVSSGNCGLHVQATCSAPPGPIGPKVPHPAIPASVGTTAFPELTGDARQNYYALRSGIAVVTQQLAACQAYARTVSGAGVLKP